MWYKCTLAVALPRFSDIPGEFVMRYFVRFVFIIFLVVISLNFQVASKNTFEFWSNNVKNACGALAQGSYDEEEEMEDHEAQCKPIGPVKASELVSKWGLFDSFDTKTNSMVSLTSKTVLNIFYEKFPRCDEETISCNNS